MLFMYLPTYMYIHVVESAHEKTSKLGMKMFWVNHLPTPMYYNNFEVVKDFSYAATIAKYGGASFCSCSA
jgi:hypothetical protein